jgi:hypothetical protein
MTRANIEQTKHTPWFAKAGAACSIVPICRFIGPSVFALKGGGYPRSYRCPLMLPIRLHIPTCL